MEVCEPPLRVLLLTKSEGEPDGVFEVTLTADGDHTVLAVEDRGVPLDHIADTAPVNRSTPRISPHT